MFQVEELQDRDTCPVAVPVDVERQKDEIALYKQSVSNRNCLLTACAQCVRCCDVDVAGS